MSSKLVETDLYFGTRLPDGRQIDTALWHRFIEKEVSTTFPDGFTVLPANGAWKNKEGVLITEQSYIVVVLSKMTPSLNKRIDSLRTKYKAAFRQESVLRVDLPVRKISF